MFEKKQAVVFAGDYGYINQIETALKSLVYHNSNLKIYIFNQDIPREWFVNYRRKLKSIGSELIDVKLFEVPLNREWSGSQHHINYMTFARYFIPQFVEEDTVLYLDSDLLVTASLEDIFSVDISDYYLAGVRHCFGLGIGFNAGVIYINNKRWREENITQKLVEITEAEKGQLAEGDQTVLNKVMGAKCLYLDDTYNYQIGFDLGAQGYGHFFLFDQPLDPLPHIVHYISGDKPWKTHSSGRLRETWWQYALMDWSEIQARWSSIYQEISLPKRKKALILTNTYLIAHIEEIVSSCPDWEFHIAAFTGMAGNLLRLEAYENVVLHPRVLGKVLEKLIAECDFYLDIDKGFKDNYFINIIKEHKKPVLSFEDTVAAEFTDYEQHSLFASHTSEDLIEYLKK